MKKQNISEFNDLFSQQTFQTMDYGQFAKPEANREIDMRHVRKLAASMLEKDLKIPILVTKQDGKLVILDGNHRFTARQFIKFPVYYQITEEEATPENMILINSNTKKYSRIDIIELYVKAGYPEYQKLKKLMDTFSIKSPTFIIELANNNPSGTLSNIINEGKFTFKNSYDKIYDYIAEMTEIANNYMIDRNILFSTGYIRALLQAWKIDGFDYKHYKKMLIYNRSLIEKKASMKQYQKMIHDIYNTFTSRQSKAEKIQIQPI